MEQMVHYQYMKGTFLVASLFGLCLLFYYGTCKEAVLTAHQSTHSNVAEMISIAQPHSKEDTPLKHTPAINDELILIDSGTDQSTVNIGEHIDIDSDSELFHAGPSLHQKNVGEFLEIDEEPSDLYTSRLAPQQNVGTFIDAGEIYFDYYFVSINEPNEVNIGEFIDLDDTY